MPSATGSTFPLLPGSRPDYDSAHLDLHSTGAAWFLLRNALSSWTGLWLQVEFLWWKSTLKDNKVYQRSVRFAAWLSRGDVHLLVTHCFSKKFISQNVLVHIWWIQLGPEVLGCHQLRKHFKRIMPFFLYTQCMWNRHYRPHVTTVLLKFTVMMWSRKVKEKKKRHVSHKGLLYILLLFNNKNHINQSH